jgi:hypothetical protein
MTNHDEPELDPKTKIEVHNYLVRFITPPAVIVSILSFVLGLSINQGAQSDALKNAIIQLMPEVNKATNDANKAALSAEQAQQASDKSVAHIQELEQSLQKDAAFVASLKSKDELVQKIADKIIAVNDFHRKFPGVVIEHDTNNGIVDRNVFTKQMTLPRKGILLVTAVGNVLSKSLTAAMGGFVITTTVDGNIVASNEQYQLNMTQLEFVASAASTTLLEVGPYTLKVEIIPSSPNISNTTRVFNVEYTAIATEPEIAVP